MSNSAFSIGSSCQTVISSSGACSITYNVEDSSCHHQLCDIVNVAGCPCPGQVMRINSAGKWVPAEAVSSSLDQESEVLGILEEVYGCGGSGTVQLAKIVYQGRVDFPGDTTLITGATYFLATQSLNDCSKTGPYDFRNTTVSNPCVSKPVMVATGLRRAVIINQRGLVGCQNGSMPSTSVIPAIEGFCPDVANGNAVFYLYNSGSADMSGPQAYSVFVDSYVMYTGSFNLAAGTFENVTVPNVNGETIQFYSAGASGTWDLTINCEVVTVTPTPTPTPSPTPTPTPTSTGLRFAVRLIGNVSGTPVRQPNATSAYTSNLVSAPHLGDGQYTTITFPNPSHSPTTVTGFLFMPPGYENSFFDFNNIGATETYIINYNKSLWQSTVVNPDINYVADDPGSSFDAGYPYVWSDVVHCWDVAAVPIQTSGPRNISIKLPSSLAPYHS